MKKFYLLIVIMIVCAVRSLGQTADTTGSSADNSNDIKPVNFSFDSNDKNYLKFDQTFPFDKIFTLHFTGIPDTVTYIEARVIFYNTSKYRHLKLGDTVNEVDLKYFRSVYVLKRWERNGNASAKTADIVEIFPLQPNTDYVIAISTGRQRKPTKGESDTLDAALHKRPEIGAAINNMARIALAKPITDPNVINKQRKTIISLISSAVTAVNPKYHVSPPDDQAQLLGTVAFLAPIKAVKAKVVSIGKLKNHPSEVAALEEQLPKINWATLQKDQVDSIVTMLNAANKKDLDNTNAANRDNHDQTIVSENTANHQMLDQNIGTLKTELAKVIAARDTMIEFLIKGVIIPNTNVWQSQSPTYRTDFVKNAKLYVTLDLGYAYVGRIDRMLAYTGINVYFRPIDKGIPLRYYTSLGDILAVRTSLLLGISFGSVAEANVRKGLIGDEALVVGAGFRVLPFLKLNGGCFVHYRYDQNPLLTQSRYYTSLSPFVSFSIDMDVKTLFSGIGNSIFK